jgi:hypothetical protein
MGVLVRAFAGAILALQQTPVRRHLLKLPSQFSRAFQEMLVSRDLLFSFFRTGDTKTLLNFRLMPSSMKASGGWFLSQTNAAPVYRRTLPTISRWQQTIASRKRDPVWRRWTALCGGS